MLIKLNYESEIEEEEEKTATSRNVELMLADAREKIKKKSLSSMIKRNDLKICYLLALDDLLCNSLGSFMMWSVFVIFFLSFSSVEVELQLNQRNNRAVDWR